MEEEYNRFLEYAQENISNNGTYTIIENLVQSYIEEQNTSKANIYMNRLKNIYKSEEAILNLYRQNN